MINEPKECWVEVKKMLMFRKRDVASLHPTMAGSFVQVGLAKLPLNELDYKKTMFHTA